VVKMAGRHLTKQQVNLYMKIRKEGLTQVTSAAKAAISERSGRRIERGQLQPKKGKMRKGSSRKDPLAAVWTSELVPRLEREPSLTPMTLLEVLQNDHPGEYSDKVLRTLQRRIKQWKALYGPAKDVMFLQEHPPGRQGLSDFTTLKKVNITINGQLFDHLLYHFRLAFSSWSYMKVICGGESYTALTSGLQEALWRLGGSPWEHRTDHLTAAFKNHKKQTIVEARKELTQRYEEFCQHYNIKATHNNLGEAHENGGIEGPHGHLKRRIQQSLLLRESNDFKSIEAYQFFIEEVVQQHNRRNAKCVDIERKQLQPLPCHKTTDFDEMTVKVSSSSTIQVKRVTYTLPSRLIGEKLRVHVYDDKLMCYLGSALVFENARVYPKDKKHRAKIINYRHVIGSLRKKPKAFRYCQFRDDLLPNSDYRSIWAYVNSNLANKEACKYIVGLLSLAAEFDCEENLGTFVLESLTLPANGIVPKLAVLRKKFGPPEVSKKAAVNVKQHELKKYDELLTLTVPLLREVCYA